MNNGNIRRLLLLDGELVLLLPDLALLILLGADAVVAVLHAVGLAVGLLALGARPLHVGGQLLGQPLVLLAQPRVLLLHRAEPDPDLGQLLLEAALRGEPGFEGLDLGLEAGLLRHDLVEVVGGGLDLLGLLLDGVLGLVELGLEVAHLGLEAGLGGAEAVELRVHLERR